MVSLLNQGLSFGSVIELYYTLTRSESQENIWWPASIDKLNLVQDHRGTTLSATIKFHARHGFRASSTTVIFKGENEVQHRDGTMYSWRFPPQVSMQGETYSSGDGSAKGSDSKDAEYSPEEQKQEPRKRSTPSSKENEGGDAQFMALKRQCISLRETTSRLEGEIQRQGAKLAQLSSKVHVDTEEGAENLGSLKFLRERIREVLGKAPSIPTRAAASEMREGYATYQQETVKKVADCTLSQFDSISDYIYRLVGDKAHFNPPFEQMKSFPTRKVRIVFRSFEHLAKVFGPTPPDELQQMLSKMKLERGSKEVTGIRILGSVVQSETNVSLPMFITIGETLPSFEVDEEQMTLLHRECMQWEEIQGTFMSPLLVQKVESKNLLSKMERVLGKESMERHLNRFQFSLTWKCESHMEIEKMFCMKPDPNDVLGSLEVVLPIVIVRDRKQSKETAEALSELWKTR